MSRRISPRGNVPPKNGDAGIHRHVPLDRSLHRYCLGARKVRYASIEEAWVAAFTIVILGPRMPGRDFVVGAAGLYPYPCRTYRKPGCGPRSCGGWHLSKQVRALNP